MSIDIYLDQWGEGASRRTAEVLPRVLRASRFVQRTFANQPEWARRMLSEGGFECPSEQPVSLRIKSAIAEAVDDDHFQAILRRFRHREMASIAVRAIAGWDRLQETLTATSLLAEAACDEAISYAMNRLSEVYGRPLSEYGDISSPVVLGLGKLGGFELNFSSDIDLIFAYTQDGQTDGRRRVENIEYFGRLAREVVRLLSTITEDGFVFRVDTMLRPFGGVGAPALSIEAIEQYYQAHGREWERYALIKARPVAGDRDAGRALLSRLRPFVYRRYLDYTALNALRHLKAAIDLSAQKRGAEDDIKLGPGGIREIEFIVQLFQLTRGGRDTRLRRPELRATLAALGMLGLLPATTAGMLDDAYVMLRRCENALQWMDDIQTHRLPHNPENWASLCAALDVDERYALADRIESIRKAVHKQFQALFSVPNDRLENRGVYDALWHGDIDAAVSCLHELGFRQNPRAVAERMVEVKESRLVRSLTENTFVALSKAVVLLACDAARQHDPETAFLRALDVVFAIGGRTTYFSLLQESKLVRTQLLRFVTESPRMVGLISQNPSLLDVLMDPRLAVEVPDRDSLQRDLAQRAGQIDTNDTEECMSLLRSYRQEMMLRIAAADLAERLSLAEVSDRLTWLAEVIIDKAVSDARSQLAQVYGDALCLDGRPAPFAVIGYGKLGSIELGYGSDLDLVFIYDIDDSERETSGQHRSLSAGEYFARLGQRIVQLLSAMTSAGRAYEVDLQLRPSGLSGLVVSRLEGWIHYQRESAWTWEQQALLRARPVSGDAALAETINEVRQEVLIRNRDTQRLRYEVREMREKMRASLEVHSGRCWDVKQSTGGLIDLEFLVQYLVLKFAATNPQLAIYTDNWRQIEALTAAGILASEDSSTLVQCGRSYREWLHHCALKDINYLACGNQFLKERTQVKKLWQQFLGDIE